MTSYRSTRSPTRRPVDSRASISGSLHVVPLDSRTPRYANPPLAAQPISRRAYVDDGYNGGWGPTQQYAVRPRHNSTIEDEYRRPSSALPPSMPSPPRRQAVLSSQYERPRSPPGRLPPQGYDSGRYLQPGPSSSSRHHQRNHSATPNDMTRLTVARSDGRERSSNYRQEPPRSRDYPRAPVILSDEGYSYTGPREQFARDVQHRDQARRERPRSTIEIPGADARREMGPASATSRQYDRLDGLDRNRLSVRPKGDSDQDRYSDVPERRHSVRPVVHQGRDDRYAPDRDDYDDRRSNRRPRDQVEDRDRHKSRDLGRPDDREQRRERDQGGYADDVRRRPKSREVSPDYAYSSKSSKSRPDDGKRPQRSRESSLDRGHRGSVPKQGSDSRRLPRSRETSPERSHLGQGLAAAGIGGIAAAGLANGLSKSSKDKVELSEDEDRKERRRRRKKRYEDDPIDDNDGPAPRSRDLPPDDQDPGMRSRRGEDPDAGPGDPDDGHGHRRHRRRRKHRDDPDAPGPDHPSESSSDQPPTLALRGARRGSRRDPEESDSDRPRMIEGAGAAAAAAGLESRTLSPGDDEDERPRRVQLVEPVKDAVAAPKPKGILKPSRIQPFPEDPNPVREGVAPLNAAGKEGIATEARWTKINRQLVNPEALKKANERFEERDDYVIVLRVLKPEDIEKLSESTREIRGKFFVDCSHTMC